METPQHKKDRQEERYINIFVKGNFTDIKTTVILIWHQESVGTKTTDEYTVHTFRIKSQYMYGGYVCCFVYDLKRSTDESVGLM